MNKIFKIAVVGGESTGKTTLSKALALTYETLVVPEYARDYLLALQSEYTESDLIQIAKGQLSLEEKYTLKANKLLFLDTDFLVLQLWSEMKFNTCHKYILNHLSTNSVGAYILTKPDFDWVYDPLREHPNVRDRQLIFRWYQELILSTNKALCIVEGDNEQRLATSKKFINNLI
ncbi:MAG: ATP-binding protein [Chitinophagaceae bacterium]